MNKTLLTLLLISMSYNVNSLAGEKNIVLQVIDKIVVEESPQPPQSKHISQPSTTTSAGSLSSSTVRNTTVITFMPLDEPIPIKKLVTPQTVIQPSVAPKPQSLEEPVLAERTGIAPQSLETSTSSVSEVQSFNNQSQDEGANTPAKVNLTQLLNNSSLPANVFVTTAQPDQLLAATTTHNFQKNKESFTTSCHAIDTSQALSFYDVITLAICNNPKVREIWLNLRHYEILYDNSYAEYLPTLNYSSGFQHKKNKLKSSTGDTAVQKSDKWQHQLELGWLLFDFGQREAKVNKAQRELFSNQFYTHAELQNVVLDAAKKYFTVIAAQAYLDAAKNNEMIANKSFEVTKAKREAGIGVLADELQAQNATLSAINSRIKAEGELQNSMGSLNSVLGINVTQNIRFQNHLTVPEQFPEQQINQLLDRAIDQHPQLLAAKEKIHASEYSLQIAQRDLLPSISLQSHKLYDRPNSSSSNSLINDDQFYMGVNINVPIFNGFRRYHEIQSAKNQLELSHNSYAQTEQGIAVQVWTSYQNLVTSQRNIQYNLELLSTSRKAYNIAQGRYRSGVGNILELLNTQNDLSQSQMQSVNSMVDWHLSRLSLAASLGQLNLTSIRQSMMLE